MDRRTFSNTLRRFFFFFFCFIYWLSSRLVTRVNPRYLSDSAYRARDAGGAAAHVALQDAGVVVFAVPSHGLRAVARAVVLAPVRRGARQCDQGARDRFSQRFSLVIGEEANGGSTRWSEVLGAKLAVEVARGLPTAVLSASLDATSGGIRPE